MTSLDVLMKLIDQIETRNLREQNVISWAAPVLSFGDLSTARIATLGINPSNREFVDLNGKELDGVHRRFHTLKSLGLKKWSEVSTSHLQLILESCKNYFHGNPYDTWFGALDKLIIDTNASYYGPFSMACHLDLVPYATTCKWTALTHTHKSELLKSGEQALALLLKSSKIEIIVLNGRSVIDKFETISDCKFKGEAIPEWTLPRINGGGVTGYAFSGTISRISKLKLNRKIKILGYSHNIQSSFGVTNQVKTSIGRWISHQTSEVLC